MDDLFELHKAREPEAGVLGSVFEWDALPAALRELPLVRQTRIRLNPLVLAGEPVGADDLVRALEELGFARLGDDGLVFELPQCDELRLLSLRARDGRLVGYAWTV